MNANQNQFQVKEPALTQRRKSLYGFEYNEPDNRRTDDRKTYEIKQLWQRSHEIVNLSARGFKNCDIAEILSITPATVSNTLNSQLGELKLSEIRLCRDMEAKKVSERIRILTNRALDVYQEIFDDESGNVSLKDKKSVADTIALELSGLRAPTRIQSESVNYTLTPEEIASFKSRGIKTASECGVSITIEDEPCSSQPGSDDDNSAPQP